MSIVRSRRGVNLVSSGDGDLVVTTQAGWPGSAGTRPPPLILCHGVQDRVDSAASGQVSLMYELAKWFTVCYTDLGGDQWGTPTHMSRIDDCRLHLQNVWGCTGLVTLVGTSMGALASLNYLRENPTLVRAVAGVIPALDLQDLHDNRGFAASIDAVYPGGYSNTVYAYRNPVLFASTIATGAVGNVPVHLFPSSTDTVAIPASVTAFKAGRPQTMVKDCGTAGHDQPTIVTATPFLVSFVRTLGGQ